MIFYFSRDFPRLGNLAPSSVNYTLCSCRDEGYSQMQAYLKVVPSTILFFIRKPAFSFRAYASSFG